MGPISRTRVPGEIKQQILDLVDKAKAKGISMNQTAGWLQIDPRRIKRWRKAQRDGWGLEDQIPGPTHADHRLLSEEKDAVLVLATDEQYADFSHRSLALLAMEKDLFFMGFSSVYRVLKERGLTTARRAGTRTGSSQAPERKEINGPNQRWCWDISYLYTYEKGLFVYLYVLLDEYSRKVLAWRVSWQATAEEACELLHEAMWAENVFDIEVTSRPEVINDRGTQMKAKSVRKLFEDHHMPQIFARPRTPNDNPYIESAFSTIKRAPEYPGFFLDVQEAENYFAVFFPWYNQKHYHSGIDYVTPEQAHQGLREKIVAERKQQIEDQRQKRRRSNQRKNQKELTPKGNSTRITTTTNMAGKN